MTDHHTPTTGRDAPPTAKQQRYLRQLAIERGVTFVIPATRAQASREIQRLLRRRPEPIARPPPRSPSRAATTSRPTAATARASTIDELTGYGSTATWKEVRS